MNPRLPIWLGTGTEANVKLTAEIADGWLPLGFVPRLMPMLRPWLEEGFRRAGGGKGFTDFEIQPRAEVIITDDVKGALRARSRGSRSTSAAWAIATRTSTRR